MKDEARRIVRASYELTQEWLRERGITKVYLMRGMRFPEEKAQAAKVSAYTAGLEKLRSLFLTLYDKHEKQRIAAEMEAQRKYDPQFNEQRAAQMLKEISERRKESLLGQLEADPEPVKTWIREALVKLAARKYGGSIPLEVQRKIRSKINKLFLAEGPVNFQLNPLSSWTSNPTIATTFAIPVGRNTAVTLFAEIPASRIVATPFTGLGCLPEYEWVVASGAVTPWMRSDSGPYKEIGWLSGGRM
jgi:hypothetical protein